MGRVDVSGEERKSAGKREGELSRSLGISGYTNENKTPKPCLPSMKIMNKMNCKKVGRLQGENVMVKVRIGLRFLEF